MNIEWDRRLPYIEALSKSIAQREEDKFLAERKAYWLEHPDPESSVESNMNKNQQAGTVFDRATNEPCPVCMTMAMDFGQLRREAVMPLPKYGPVSVNGVKICFDCQAAENLVKYGILFDFEPARTAVANERQETLRLPLGMAQLRGMCMEGLIKPASEDDFDNHLAWLDNVYPVDADNFNYG